MNLTSAQIRAARAMLRWSQSDLADKSGASVPTIKRLEKMEGAIVANRMTIEAITRAFTDAGIEFTSNGSTGVKLRT